MLPYILSSVIVVQSIVMWFQSKKKHTKQLNDALVSYAIAKVHPDEFAKMQESSSTFDKYLRTSHKQDVFKAHSRHFSALDKYITKNLKDSAAVEGLFKSFCELMEKDECDIQCCERTAYKRRRTSGPKITSPHESDDDYVYTIKE